MKKMLLLLLVCLVVPSVTGCGICQRARNFIRRGAVCGTQAGPVYTTPVAATAVPAPAPITYAQPRPTILPRRNVVPQYAAPQYVAPQCCPCQPCCPPVVDPCCEGVGVPCCPNGCCDGGTFGYMDQGYLPGEYAVGAPISDSGWQCDCDATPVDGASGDTMGSGTGDQPTDATAPGPG